MRVRKYIGCQNRLLNYLRSISSGVLLALGLSGAMLADGWYTSANAGPFPACPEDMYIMRAETGQTETNFNKIDVYNRFSFDMTPHPSNSGTYNAAGFNIVDNYIYAIRNSGASGPELIRIHSDGFIEVVPVTSEFTIPTVFAADVGADGFMYIYHTDRIYRLDLKNPSASGAMTRVGVPAGTPAMSDVAYYNGNLYGVATTTGVLLELQIDNAVWAPPGTAMSLIPVNTIADGPKVDALFPAAEKMSAYGFGAMFGGSNGLYGNLNAGGFFKFDLTTGLAQKLANSDPTSSNDGAKCYASPLRLPTEISLSKTSYPDINNPEPTYAPGKKTQYRVVVTNDYTLGAAGIHLYDPLPAGVTEATWKCEQAIANPSFPGCTPKTGTGPLNAFVAIGITEKSFVSYIVEVDVPPNVTGDLVNKVTMTMPQDSYQSDLPPQTATVTKIPALLTVEKKGVWVDTNKSNSANFGDHMNYTFTVTNSGDVPLTDITIDDPMVVVSPASVASLAPGETAIFTATYAVTQRDIDNAEVVNTAVASGKIPGGGTTESPPGTTVTEFPPSPEVSTKKSGRFLDDLNPNEFPDEGEHLEFAVTVKNSGNVTMVAYPPIDAGPTVNGKPMTGELSSFRPDKQIIPPGEEREFIALYTLTKSDVTEASGLLDAVQNTVETPVQTLKEFEEGKVPQPHPLEKPNIMTLPGYAIKKTAHLSPATRGQIVPYTISVRPVDVSGKATLRDQTPSGFRYLPGSGRVAGSAVEPKIQGQELIFDLNVETGVDTKIEYALVVTGAVSLGKHKNKAQVFQPGQMTKPVSAIASEEVEIIPDPVFDCSDLLGKVFDDKNRNGHQDENETGMAGIRLTDVKGNVITTDKHGRFSIACADLPQRIGSNFILKLDPRSLPSGYRVVSENPRVIRLTSGKISEISFAVTVGRVVRIDINDAAFEQDTTELKPEWMLRLESIIELLETEPSVLHLSYVGEQLDKRKMAQRVAAIRRSIADRWREVPNRYRLEIETNISSSLAGNRPE